MFFCWTQDRLQQILKTKFGVSCCSRKNKEHENRIEYEEYEETNWFLQKRGMRYSKQKRKNLYKKSRLGKCCWGERSFRVIKL